jgi:hypothetical protein
MFYRFGGSYAYCTNDSSKEFKDCCNNFNGNNGYYCY